MPTRQDEIREWFARGKQCGARFMLVVVDSFSYEDYPSFVKPGEDIKAAIDGKSCNMQRVVEVYDLAMDMESQLREPRPWHVGS